MANGEFAELVERNICASERRPTIARGSSQASEAGKAAQGFSNQQNANAMGLFGTLAPELETEIAHPAGFAPSDLAAMNTATQQSAGGSEAAAVGQGALKAARTGNAGGSDAAIGAAARGAGETASKGALATQMANARLKESQRSGAERGLEGLYGITSGDVTPALNSVANNVNANTNAQNASWDWAKFLLDPAMAAAGQGAGMAAMG